MERIPGKPTPAVLLQRQYYTETAARYDEMHAHEGGADPSILQLVIGFARMLEARSLLDVGTANARALRSMKPALAGCVLYGVEPVAALISQAAQPAEGSGVHIVRATGEALPFPDGSIDIVCEFATLHHAPDPNAIVSEMLRVARKAVILCDSNRFGQGSIFARLFKLTLYKFRLWGAFNYFKTLGRGYSVTKGDGVAYSYSAYDSFHLIERWADRVIPIPSERCTRSSWFHPLLTSGGVILCGIKYPQAEKLASRLIP